MSIKGIGLLPAHGWKRPVFALASFRLRQDYAGQVAAAGKSGRRQTSFRGRFHFYLSTKCQKLRSYPKREIKLGGFLFLKEYWQKWKNVQDVSYRKTEYINANIVVMTYLKIKKGTLK